MPFSPVHKSYSPIGPPLSSYLPPGHLNTMLLGRLDFPGSTSSGGMYANRSPLLSLGGYGYSGGYGGSSYGSAYSGPPYISSPIKKYGSGLPSLHEHSSRHARVSRVPQFNHISSSPIIVNKSNSTLSPPRASIKKIAVFNTEDIDVTTPRRSSRDESASEMANQNNQLLDEDKSEEEMSLATPGEISRKDNQSFGTIRRGRTVIRIQTQHLKENPYLITEERKDKKPKKTTGEKLKEKWAIQSKKKKHSGYRRPSLSDIRAQQAALQKEIEERQASLLSQRDALLSASTAAENNNTNYSSDNNNLTQSQEREEKLFFNNVDKLPRRKSTKKFLIVRQCSKDNLLGETSLPSPEVTLHPVALSRSNSNVSAFSIPEELQGNEDEEPVEGTRIDVTEDSASDEIDFWASEGLKSHRSTMIVRSFFRPINQNHYDYPPAESEVQSINEEEENCDLEIANILKNKKPLPESQREVQVLKELEDIFSKSQIVPDTCLPQDDESHLEEKTSAAKNDKALKRGKKNEAGVTSTTKDEKTEKTKSNDIIADPKTSKIKPKPSDILVPKEESLHDKTDGHPKDSSVVEDTFPHTTKPAVDSATSATPIIDKTTLATTTTTATASPPKVTGPLKKFKDFNRAPSSEEATPTSSPNLPGKSSVFKFDSSPASSPTFPANLKNKLGKADLFPKLKCKSESPQLTKPEFLTKKKEFPGKQPLNETKPQFSPPWKKPAKKEDNLKQEPSDQQKTKEPSSLEKVETQQKPKEPTPKLESPEKEQKETGVKTSEPKEDKLEKFPPKKDDNKKELEKKLDKADVSPFTKAKSQEVENINNTAKEKGTFSTGDVPKQIEEITKLAAPAEKESTPTPVISIPTDTLIKPSTVTEIASIEKKEIKSEVTPETKNIPDNKKNINQSPNKVVPNQSEEKPKFPWMKDINKVATPPATPPPLGVANSPKLNKKIGEAKKNIAKPTALKNNTSSAASSVDTSSSPQSPATPPGPATSKLATGAKSAKSGKNIFGLQNRAKSKEEKRKSLEDSKTDEQTVTIVQLHTSAVVSTGEDETQISEDSGIEVMGKASSEQEDNKASSENSDWNRSSGNNNTTGKDATVTQVFESFTVKSHVEIEQIVDTCQIIQESNKSGPALSESLTSASSTSSSSSTSVLPNPIVQGIIRDSLNRCSSEGSSGSVDGDSPPLTPKSSERDGSTSTTSSSTLSAGTSGSRRMPSPPSDDSDEDQETIANRICPTKQRPKFRKYEVQDFQFLKVLGKGSFGKVLLAELKGTDCYFAIKCLKKDVVLEDDDVECTMIERKVLLMGSKHPYLCHLLCTFQTESHLFFVMEYLNGGDLMFHIQQTGRFTEERARFYGAEIVSGLKFLHKKGIIYRDLKLDNILLDFEGHVRIADFGMCKLQIYLDRTADTFCGTPDYMAPEIIKGLKYNQCVDWWAFGILLYEMLIGQSPFSGCDEDELFWSICNESVRYPRFLSRESKRILEMLLEKDSSKRLGTSGCPHGDVKDQPFFQPINWDRLERREMEPPFKPKLKHSLDVQYFDTTFTKEAPRLTPVDKEILRSMDQTQFDGFSYTNPHTTD